MQFSALEVARVLSISNFYKCLYFLFYSTSLQMSKGPGFDHLIILEFFLKTVFAAAIVK